MAVAVPAGVKLIVTDRWTIVAHFDHLYLVQWQAADIQRVKRVVLRFNYCLL